MFLFSIGMLEELPPVGRPVYTRTFAPQQPWAGELLPVFPPPSSKVMMQPNVVSSEIAVSTEEGRASSGNLDQGGPADAMLGRRTVRSQDFRELMKQAVGVPAGHVEPEPTFVCVPAGQLVPGPLKTNSSIAKMSGCQAIPFWGVYGSKGSTGH